MKTWYLAHQYKHRRQVLQIEKDIESRFKIFLMNPFYDTDQKEVMLKYDSGELDAFKMSMKDTKKTMDDDLMWIRNTDGLLAIILSESDIIGTFMEIFYASRIMNKPVYLVCPVKKIAMHPWIKLLSFKIFKNLKELEAYFIENDMVYK